MQNFVQAIIKSPSTFIYNLFKISFCKKKKKKIEKIVSWNQYRELYPIMSWVNRYIPSIKSRSLWFAKKKKRLVNKSVILGKRFLRNAVENES